MQVIHRDSKRGRRICQDPPKLTKVWPNFHQKIGLNFGYFDRSLRLHIDIHKNRRINSTVPQLGKNLLCNQGNQLLVYFN
jgi:hypothetical protein